MFGLTISQWITVALLTPLWWAAGLLVVALLGDRSASWRVRASRLFGRLEGRQSAPIEPAATFPGRRAA